MRLSSVAIVTTVGSAYFVLSWLTAVCSLQYLPSTHASEDSPASVAAEPPVSAYYWFSFSCQKQLALQVARTRRRTDCVTCWRRSLFYSLLIKSRKLLCRARALSKPRANQGFFMGRINNPPTLGRRGGYRTVSASHNPNNSIRGTHRHSFLSALPSNVKSEYKKE